MVRYVNRCKGPSVEMSRDAKLEVYNQREVGNGSTKYVIGR